MYNEGLQMKQRKSIIKLTVSKEDILVGVFFFKDWTLFLENSNLWNSKSQILRCTSFYNVCVSLRDIRYTKPKEKGSKM